jgi:hypothetical protein
MGRGRKPLSLVLELRYHLTLTSPTNAWYSYNFLYDGRVE